MAAPPKCKNCGHVPHPGGVCNVGPCDCSNSEVASTDSAAAFGPIAAHGTDTSDGTWDGPAADTNCPAESAPLRASHAWVDPDGDPDAKSSYKFVHHEVGTDGAVGAANLTGCSTGIGVLNGGRGGTKIPQADYDGVYNHLARHLRDGDREPPEKDYSTGGTSMAAGSGTRTRRVPTKQYAKQQLPEAPAADSTGTPYRRWRMPVAVLEGVKTGDGRRIATEALTWRDLPQPLMANTQTTQGHDGAELVGRIDSAERVDASKMVDSRTGKPYGKGAQAVMLSGVFTNDELAAKVAQLVADRFLRGVSVDLSDVEYELMFVDDDGEPIDQDADDPLIGLLTGDAEEMVTKGRIMGATITPFPAFEGAFIELVDENGNVGPATQPGRPTAAQQKTALRIRSDFSSRTCAPCADGQPLVAGGGPQYPPASWFEDPELDGPTPLVVLDDGRLVFHLALWDTCHTGYTGQCVKAPHSAINYALFRTGAVKTAEGSLVATGPLTVDTSHAGLHDSRLAALRHYDHTGTAVADVAVGEDSFGIWCAGALRPDVTENQLRVLRASATSGDWRDWGGNLELIAILAVNTPGLPVTRQFVASGMPQALLAAGGQTLAARTTVASEIGELARYLPELLLMRQGRAERARQRVAEARAVAARTRLAASTGQ
jgi:hypothetical protein